MMNLKSQKGFTMVEIAIVVILIAAAVGLSILYLQSSQVRADVNAEVTDFVGNLRLAQSNAKAGLNNTSHGVHLEADSYTVFQGDVYAALDPLNFTVELPPTISIENIALNGGGNNIIFDPPQGETSTFGTLQFNSAQINKTVDITITSIGTVNF